MEDKKEHPGDQYYRLLVKAAKKADAEFKVKRPDDLDELKEMCDLCQHTEYGFCCPEHCCDVSVFKHSLTYFLSVVGHLPMRALQGEEKYRQEGEVPVRITDCIAENHRRYPVQICVQCA